ncbi:uncharacterized protein B0I36DRAFT_367303 [Microdochium trichocladiopsis]|uniref:Uncharacterized protein n=1 Tax=Microdochium trichocladiopsis TaxID=1682393 RepID=A0A9P9BNF2_9PEZI|nr:uncharacterized protein B0I36DRAFT_367303 [Microdochium trichocladiopsis]KAH7020818.1 hypothetical protein B0I36DRAFT_367303 [Microdochium trichocladiopsis]
MARFTIIQALAAAVAVAGSAAALGPRHGGQHMCARDKCLNGVSRGPLSLKGDRAASVASKDCAWFLDVTVTPCPVTITATVTALQTPGTVTDVVTLVATETEFLTDVVTEVTTTTPVTTEITSETSVSTVTELSSSTETIVSVSTTTTTTSTTTVSSVPLKRAVPTSAGRANCPASSTKPVTSIPCYAPCGKTAAAYSSACSCLGVKGTTTTLPASTVKVTVTATASVPAVTATQTTSQTTLDESVTTTTTQLTLTAATPSTTTTTTTLPSTTTTTTTLVQTTFTQTTTTTTITALTVLPTSCNLRLQVASGGTYTGQYATNYRDARNPLALTPDQGDAAVLHQEYATGYLRDGDSNIGSTRGTLPANIFFGPLSDTSLSPLVCQRGAALSCRNDVGGIVFMVCPNEDSQLRFGAEVSPNCQEISFVKVCV